MDGKETSYDLRDPGRAPEVAPSHSPIPTYREFEGLQPSYDAVGGKETVREAAPWTKDEKAAFVGEEAVQPQPRKWYRRKRWIAALALLLLAVIAVAVGAGIGASSTSSSDNSKSGGQSEAQSNGQGNGHR